MHIPAPLIMFQENSEPWKVPGLLTIGPTLFALTMHQIIKMRHAMDVHM